MKDPAVNQTANTLQTKTQHAERRNKTSQQERAAANVSLALPAALACFQQ